MGEWDGYILTQYQFLFEPGAVVLDVGCGEGDQMEENLRVGNRVTGVDLDWTSLLRCRERGLNVTCARAEKLPFADSSFDGILCKVVLPYTREEEAIAEFARLLKPGGTCYLIGHGSGYYLKYIVNGPGWKDRVHGLRVLLNTWAWGVTGKRLPGFLGQTIYQSRRRMGSYFERDGFSLVSDTASKRFLGLPVFTYQLVEKTSR